ncbi:MAG: helix-turn-helix domain-containing protein [Candidatus Hodarchaeales archaeon]
MQSVTITRVDDNQSAVNKARNNRIPKKNDVIYSLLSSYGPMTRRELMLMSGYAWSTIYDILYRLELKGKVERFSRRIIRGRPRVYWKVI